MKNEAIKRIELLVSMGLRKKVLDGMKKDGQICYAEPEIVSGRYTAINHTFDENDEFKKIKEKYENESGNMVYYGMYHTAPIGPMLTLFIIKPDDSTWDAEREKFPRGFANKYVYFLNDDYGREDEIVFEFAKGGLVRVG